MLFLIKIKIKFHSPAKLVRFKFQAIPKSDPSVLLGNSKNTTLTTETFRSPRSLIFILAEGIELIRPNQMGDLFSNRTACRHLSLMFFAVAFFHISEYFLAIIIHGRSRVPLSSLLISNQYLLAMGFSLLEYAVEIGLVPEMKELWWVSYAGLVLVVIGEVIRKAAIITAGRAFTHMIKIYHEEHHELVRHGIYGIMRHPGYCGFFVWAIGIQIMMCNPLSTVAFTTVLWNFFSKRIRYEEYFLRQFFGSEYEEYSKQVPSGVPFVK